MADPSAKLEITPKVIDLGDKVIQLSHVTSAGHGATHPFRPVGFGLLVAAAGLIGFEGLTRGLSAFALKSGGTLSLWFGFAAAGIGLFLILYARRLLVIRTSDGARTILPSSDETASAALVERIRDAMEARGDPAVSERPRNQPLHVGTAPSEATLPNRTPAERALPAATPQSQPQAQIAAQPAYTQPLGVNRRTPDAHHVNGHAGNPAFSIGASRNDAPAASDTATAGGRRPLTHQQALQPTGGPSARVAQSAGLNEALQHATGRDALALPSTQPTAPPRDDGAHDLRLLIEHVRRADVQHKDALLDLLRVVDEYFHGRASREDAVAHWRSFADYVMQYLSNVDGMMSHTERFGRHILIR